LIYAKLLIGVASIRDSKTARAPRPDKVDKINILAGIIKAEIAIVPDLNGYLAA
jgi:hypothetical protein